jgi:hypothetical protein
MGGCSTRPYRAAEKPTIPVSDIRTPSDFAIAATLFVDTKGPADLEPIRFVIQPDGVLRAARGAGVSLEILPPRTRDLTQNQLSQIYNLAVREGLDRGIGGSDYAPGQPPAIAEGKGVLVIEFTAHDTRKVSQFDFTDHAGAQSLVATLRQLARIQ